MSRQPDPAADTDGEAAEFAEVDPSGRYGKYDQILGKGAFKTVFRAFDEIDGIEVAWNQIKLNDVLRSPEDLERLYSEVHLLKSLNHKNIIKFYYSWVDTKSSNVNFITEIFTSGNLRQYRRKHRRVDMKAIKHWARQILRGLLYLHSQNPPIIHRDLKCDNIFVNGNQGEVKIGDLGLAGILRQAHPAHSVIGTPEFMAPELYEEDYNELVDIYSFGMCLLEMVTLEYPYSECVNAAQIYKKVSSGKKPAALSKVQDPQMRAFMEKCLAKASTRLPARELLMDPFLQERNPHEFKSTSEMDDFESLLGCSVPANLPSIAPESSFAYEPPKCRQHQDLHRRSRDFRVKVRRRDDDTIFLKLRIADQEGCIRNIHFPFDVEADTALCVASEMVEELDLSDQDVTTIADMIDSEIMLLVPHWNPGACFEEHSSVNQEQQHETDCDNSEIDSLSPQNQGTMHGRFEEFTYHSLPHFRPGVDDVPGEEAFPSPLEWEIRFLAHKHEQELRNLQTQHDQALMELKAQYKNKRLRNNSSNFFFRSSSNCRPSLKELALCTSQVQLMDEQTCFLDDLNSSSSSSYQMKKISCGQDLQRRKQQLVEALEARSSMEGGRNSLSRSTSFSAAACQTA